MNTSPPGLRALLLALALFSSGCFMSREGRNEPLDPAVLQALKPGESTGADVAAILGAPNEVVQLGRRSAWLYEYVLGKRAGLFLLVVAFQNLDSRSDRVWVFFDQNDVLMHVASTYEAQGTEWAMPWQSLEIPEENPGPQQEDGGASE